MKPKSSLYLSLLLFLFGLSACTEPYKREAQKVLPLAGDNRAELEKVIEHFANDEDPLKRLAAWFLIANMPYHAGFEGKDIEAYDSAYLRMAKECPEYRDSVFKALTEKIGFVVNM